MVTDNPTLLAPTIQRKACNIAPPLQHKPRSIVLSDKHMYQTLYDAVVRLYTSPTASLGRHTRLLVGHILTFIILIFFDCSIRLRAQRSPLTGRLVIPSTVVQFSRNEPAADMSNLCQCHQALGTRVLVPQGCRANMGSSRDEGTVGHMLTCATRQS